MLQDKIHKKVNHCVQYNAFKQKYSELGSQVGIQRDFEYSAKSGEKIFWNSFCNTRTSNLHPVLFCEVQPLTSLISCVHVDSRESILTISLFSIT